MAILPLKGDVTESVCQTILCTTNCVGAMGAGVALAIKKKYPSVYEQYRQFHKDGLLKIDMILHAYPEEDPSKLILLFPTKIEWRYKSRLEWIETNLENLAKTWYVRGVESLAMPLPGCGNGGADKDIVTAMVYDAFGDTDLPVVLYT